VSPHTQVLISLGVIVTDCARSAVTSAEKGVRRDATATTAAAAAAAAEVTQRNYLSLSGSLSLSLNGEEGTSSLAVFIFYSAGVGAAGKLVKPARATGGGEAGQVGREGLIHARIKYT
jgi:hypothetical protein